MENFNEHFKGFFEMFIDKFPNCGLIAIQRFTLGTIFVYQLALLYGFEDNLEHCVVLKSSLKAA